MNITPTSWDNFKRAGDGLKWYFQTVKDAKPFVYNVFYSIEPVGLWVSFQVTQGTDAYIDFEENLKSAAVDLT